MQASHKTMLALEDGTVFEGWSIGYPGEITGELVFNTSMCITTLSGASAAVNGIESLLKRGMSVKSIQEYHQG